MPKPKDRKPEGLLGRRHWGWLLPFRPKMSLLTELGNFFGWGLQIFRAYGAAATSEFM
jgi:hypothetical protein